MSIISRTRQAVNRRPTQADRAAYLAMLADSGEAGHFDGPTPIECYTEPWASWPAWTDADRWTLSDAEADRLAGEAQSLDRMEAGQLL